MRVRRKQVKKKIIFVLLLTLLVSMVRPSGSYAAELKEGTPEEKMCTGDKSEIKQTEIGTDNEEESNNDSDGDDEDMLNSESDEVNSTRGKERAGQFESDVPVIEKVEFGQNHTTVASDAEISLSVYAYDASEIKDVQAYIRAEDSLILYSMEWKKGSKEKEYVCTYQLDGKMSGRLTIDSVKVVDEYNNAATWNSYDELEGYWVDIKGLEDETNQVKSFDFLQNGKTIDFSTFSGSILSMELELQKPIEEKEVWLNFTSSGEESFSIGIYASDEGSVHSVFNSNGCTWRHISFKSAGEYTYALQDVYIERGNFGTKIPVMMDNKEDYGFTLKVNEADVEGVATITSVSMDKQGENVKQGDKVNITVNAENANGKKLPARGSVYFRSAVESIDPNQKYVNLELSEEDNQYHGVLKIEDMYPCEWYISSVYIGNNTDTDGDFFYGAGFPYYVRVYNGDAFMNPEFDVNINFMALDENGKYQTISTISKKNVQRRQTLKEIGVVFPEMSSDYPGLTQLGWMDWEGKEVTEDTSVLYGNFDVYAKYDKGVFRASYRYPKSDGSWTNEFLDRPPIVYNYGKTYGELVKEAQAFMPEDMIKDYSFIGWEDQGYEEDKVLSGVEGAAFIANFSGVTVLEVYQDYYDKKGNKNQKSEVLAVTEGTKESDVIEKLNKSDPPEMYEGLRFKEWNSYPYLSDMTGIVGNGQTFVMKAVCENCLVRYIINGENIFCQVAEKGEKVKALTSFDGFGEVTWDPIAPDKTFVVNEDMTFYGSADSSSDNPDKPSKPSKPSEPTKPSGGSTPDSGNQSNGTSDSRLPDSAVDSIIRAVNNAGQGENIDVNMGSKTVISKDILEAARGKDVSITLIMEGYSWTINGKDIMAANLQDIDLRVIKNTDHIPSSTVKALAGDNPCMQITLVHEGNFGFKATLNIGVGSEYAGKYGNLYYHDSAGKMVFVNAGQIDSAGNVSLEFSHASDYLLVMSNQAMSQADVPADLMPAGSGQNGTSSAANSGIRKSAKTGDYTMLYPWLLLCAAAMGIVVYVSRRRRVQ